MTVDLKTQYREAVKELKRQPDKEAEITAYIKANAFNISAYSWFFVSLQMKRLGYDGIPYRDCKTLHGWNAEGKYIKCGEHSKISGIVWMRPLVKTEAGELEENQESRLYAKEYKLFHRSQLR